MNKFLKNCIGFLTIIAAVAGIIGVYFQVATRKPIIEVKSISIDKLTELPSVEGLRAVYTFKNDTVNSLWKLHYLISNVGDENIIGEGNKKNIIRDGLRFQLSKEYRIIDFRIIKNEFPFQCNLKNNDLELAFLQWKPKESFEIILYAEQFRTKIEPKLSTNDREIIDGEVRYTTIYKEIDKNERIFDKLPSVVQSILWWTGIIVFGFLIIGLPIVGFIDIIKWIKYQRWKKNNYWMYKEWVDTLISENKLESFKQPKELPYRLWKEYPYIMPAFPDNDLKVSIWALLLGMIIFSIPLLLLISV